AEDGERGGRGGGCDQPDGPPVETIARWRFAPPPKHRAGAGDGEDRQTGKELAFRVRPFRRPSPQRDQRRRDAEAADVGAELNDPPQGALQTLPGIASFLD